MPGYGLEYTTSVRPARVDDLLIPGDDRIGIALTDVERHTVRFAGVQCRENCFGDILNVSPRPEKCSRSDGNRASVADDAPENGGFPLLVVKWPVDHRQSERDGASWQPKRLNVELFVVFGNPDIA